MSGRGTWPIIAPADAVAEWRDVPGYEGVYQVSSHGHVRSLPRQVLSRWGNYRRIPGQPLQATRASNGRLSVGLSRSQKHRTIAVHKLVADAFLADSYFPGAWVCHGDGDPDNNHVSNLRWGTNSDNQLDSVKHGTHKEARKTHCTRNHPYSPENTYFRPSAPNKRRCRLCDRLYSKNQWKSRRAA